MAVYNFYVEANIEGRATILGGGPRNKNGGMTVDIHQRNDGSIDRNAVSIHCHEYEGKLITRVIDHEGKTLFIYETDR